ncbi:heparanase [Polypterus senegalus]|uniref:heparanase n=1 Tax=Polypterus senegalus TaxID=55291 RepID=UPI00196591C0|nr:heparanase [Polypterus senegalus]
MLALAVLILTHTMSAASFPEEEEVEVARLGVDIDAEPLAIVNERFLSVAIDASLAGDEKFISILGSQKLRTLAKGLAPGYLRFGGTKADFTVFLPDANHVKAQLWEYKFIFQNKSADNCYKSILPYGAEKYLKNEWLLQDELILRNENQNIFNYQTISGSSVDMLYAFASCSGFHLIFGLNALLRNDNNVWNSSNAEQLLKYCQSKQYRISWELGNEPNSFEKKAGIKVDGSQLGKDFIHLHNILQKYPLFQSSSLYGPDVGQPQKHRRKLLNGFMKAAGKVINACTWHHYYVDGRDTSLDEFLSPAVLDSFAVKSKDVFQMVEKIVPGKKVWLGETGSAFGGGAPGLSDTYAAGFMWLDKLGLSAKLGIDVVIRQVFVGAGSYHLVDSNFDPLPDYWLSLLYKKLVGPEVLNVTIFTHDGDQNRHLRVYMHCTRNNSTNFKSGDVTLIALNLSKKTTTIHLPEYFFSKRIDAYQLEPAGEGGLSSRNIQLNGKLLVMVDERTLPELTGSTLPVGSPLQIPGFTFAFYVIRDANVSACK